MSYENVPENVKHVVDGIAAYITISAVMGWIANATAVLSLVWVIIRLYETNTVQGWLGKKRRKYDADE